MFRFCPIHRNDTEESNNRFCGETDDFCDTGCQEGFGGCGNVTRPSCSSTGSTVNKRTIGYYESWSNTRQCEAISPQDLNLNGFTHVNFAFAFFDPSTFLITPMDSNAASLYSQFTDLKGTYSGLQTWISVGGWSFTDRKYHLVSLNGRNCI
jgi:chitinase